METNNSEVLLQVKHLCQYFKMGKGELKAVDDVSFDIKKGEVFGLVGESGCGKTTTGRSIIKLYDITSGDVIFKGVRICAGKRSYEQAIANAKKEFGEKMAAASNEAEKKRLNDELSAIIAENKKKIAEANYDQKHCDKEYREKRAAEVTEKYQKLIEQASGEQKQQLQTEFANELRKAKKTRLVTQIQMIFQDPIASLDPRMTVREIIS